MWKTLLAVLALIIIAGPRADAQGAYLGPQVGIYNASEADNPRPMFGAALRVKLSPSIGVEGSINYRKEDYADGGVTATSWPVMVTGLLYPLPIVYGAVGAGWYNTKFDYKVVGLAVPSETKQEFGWHFGAGAELPLGSSTKIVGDIRYVFLNYDFKQVPGVSDLKANFYVITVGVLFGL